MASESPSLEVIWRLDDYIVKGHRSRMSEMTLQT
jgi:hypothetical protein